MQISCTGQISGRKNQVFQTRIFSGRLKEKADPFSFIKVGNFSGNVWRAWTVLLSFCSNA